MNTHNLAKVPVIVMLAMSPISVPSCQLAPYSEAVRELFTANAPQTQQNKIPSHVLRWKKSFKDDDDHRIAHVYDFNDENGTPRSVVVKENGNVYMVSSDDSDYDVEAGYYEAPSVTKLRAHIGVDGKVDFGGIVTCSSFKSPIDGVKNIYVNETRVPKEVFSKFLTYSYTWNVKLEETYSPKLSFLLLPLK